MSEGRIVLHTLYGFTLAFTVELSVGYGLRCLCVYTMEHAMVHMDIMR